MADFDTIDYFTDDTLVDDPYPYFEHLRVQCPVVQESQRGVIAVSGYEEAMVVYHDSEAFSSCNAVMGPIPGLPETPVGDDVNDLIDRVRDQLPMHEHMITHDPPSHTELRALLMRLITPKRLKENEAFMWRLADRQLDEFMERGRCEFIKEYSQPFALLTVADLLGVPEADHALFRDRLGAQRPGAMTASDQKWSTLNPLEFLDAWFTSYVEERRTAPRDDVLTGLALATFPDGSVPPVPDVVRTATFLFAAGQETTARLLASALKILAERPELQRVLRDDRSRIPQFVEETLRFESPVKSDFRLSRRTTELAGVPVPAGTCVMVLIGAANRDPNRFDHPAEFNIDRANAREHIAFGRGIHTCPGAPLARAEAVVSLNRILDRMDDIRVDGTHHGPPGAREFSYEPTYILRALRALHLEFTPRDGTTP